MFGMRIPCFWPLVCLALSASIGPAPAAAVVVSGAVKASVLSDAPVLQSAARPNLPWSLLSEGIPGPVDLRVRVTLWGTVDSVQVVAGDPRVRAAAIDAARWHVYSAPTEPTWVALRIELPRVGTSDPLSPDPIAMALEAEQSGDLRGAIDAWTGAIARVGRHPSLQDDLAIRARILQLVRRMPQAPPVPNAAAGPARGANHQHQRNMSSAVSRELLTVFDRSLAIAPWFSEGYRWRAAALAGCGRIGNAKQAVLLYRLSARDSVGLAVAERALKALAHSDTIGAAQLLKF